MALEKQIMHLSFVNTDGTTVTLDGDQAQNFLQQIEAMNHGGNAYWLTYTDDNGNTQYISRRCLCNVTKLPNTQEAIEDPECGDADCIPDYVPAPPAS